MAAVLVAAIATAYRQSPGWGLRVLAVALLIGVMIQGLLGGLRVHLDVILGKGLSVIHASFSQVVFGLAMIIAMLCRPADRQTRGVAPGTRAWSLVALAAIYVQIVAGAMVRHLSSPMGPRLHLLLAFVSVVALVITCGRLWRVNLTRGLVIATLSIVAVQLLLGMESWLVRFADGFTASEFRRITEEDAVLRTVHAVVGYLLFAASIVLAVRVNQASATSPSRVEAGVLEGVA